MGMIKVKMFVVDKEWEWDENRDADNVVYSGLTDWEDIDEKDYWNILDWINQSNKKQREKWKMYEKNGGRYQENSNRLHIIAQLDTKNFLPDCIDGYKEMMKEYREKEKTDEKKRAKAAATRKENKKVKAAAAELEQYNKLKAKFDES